MNNNILVSICVITYNSSSTVFETLESIKEQTYKNIELIISDDGSTDNTLEVCQEWLTKNKQRFNRIELISVEKNTGTPSNCNRAVKAAKGEWIKLIAGDDCLALNGINDFVTNFKGKELLIVCNYQLFYVDKDGNRVYSEIGPNLLNKKKISKSANGQFKELILMNFITAPSLIINRILFDKVGYFDESYHYIEDYTFLLTCTLHKYKISYLPIMLAYYRRSEHSITMKNDSIIHEGLDFEHVKLYREFKHKHVSFFNFLYWGTYYNYMIRRFIVIKILNNKNTKLNRLIYKLIYIQSPIYIYNKILSLVSTKNREQVTK